MVTVVTTRLTTIVITTCTMATRVTNWSIRTVLIVRIVMTVRILAIPTRKCALTLTRRTTTSVSTIQVAAVMGSVMMCSTTPLVIGMEVIAVRVPVLIRTKTAARPPVTIVIITYTTMTTLALNWKAMGGTVMGARCVLLVKKMFTTSTARTQTPPNMRCVTSHTPSTWVICIVMCTECTILLNVTGTVATVASNPAHRLTMLQMTRPSQLLSSVTRLGTIVGIQHSRASAPGRSGPYVTAHVNTHEFSM